MRVTLDISAETYRRLKARATKEGLSVSAIILRGVKLVLSNDAAHGAVQLPLVRSKRPGKLRIDSARIYDVISFP